MSKKQDTSSNILPARSDVIFKLLFGNEANKDILTDFLKAVLQIPEEEFTKITIVDPHLLRRYKGDKLGILDVKIETKAGKL